MPDAARAQLPFADAAAAQRAAVGEQAAVDVRQATAAAEARPLQLTYDLRHAVEAGYAERLPNFMHELSRAEAEPLARLQAALDWCLSAEGRAYTLAELVPAWQALRLSFCPTRATLGQVWPGSW
ncbi:MAG: hypothetical protein WKG07_01905 [Hymenobacter sp.]